MYVCMYTTIAEKTAAKKALGHPGFQALIIMSINLGFSGNDS